MKPHKLTYVTRGAIVAAFAAASVACATTPPSVELVEARRVYETAEKSHAPELAPDKMLDARELMTRAQKAHEEDPGSEREKHLAYLANRRARIAMAHGEMLDARRDRQSAKDMYVETQSEIITRTRQDNRRLQEAYRATTQALMNTESELASINQELGNKEKMLGTRVDSLQQRAEELRTEKEELMAKRAELEKSLASTEEELTAEREARKDAEARAEEALTKLENIASVRAEQNETIITLSGSVVFEFGTARLLPIARQKLEGVAVALKAQDAKKTIVVEGHTDAKGSDAFNQQLSQQRAEAVKEFLVDEGIAAERIRAVGRGESEPVASNDSPEGRATNRRVEIVLREG